MRSSRHNQRWPRPRDGPSHRLAITVPCCAHFREGPVLAILAMLALKDALCVAPGGSAPLFPFRSAPWPPMFQAGTGKRRLNRTRKPARHDRSHALTTQKGTSWRCGNRGHFGVALTVPLNLLMQTDSAMANERFAKLSEASNGLSRAMSCRAGLVATCRYRRSTMPPGTHACYFGLYCEPSRGEQF